uniref:Chemotaxis sensory transducer n=1 Tax=uncultured bacterium contig00019 TaxID=1181510 RepID=A0A806KE76_9BACT|nr:chemotaxis sensory transducer [uncultured bacterium contig00019]
MDIKNIKLTAKLAVSVASFLLPLGILLFTVISMSVASIQKDRKELYGIEVLRPAMSLMQTIPQYIRYYVDNAPGDLEFTKQYVSDLLNELESKYSAHFGNETPVVTMQTFNDNWNHMSNTGIQSTVLWAYNEFMRDLARLIDYVGDISGLVTNSELESAYLVAAAVHELPQAQERIVIIGNLLRTMETGSFTQRRRTELQLNLNLLFYSDNEKIQRRFNTLVLLDINNMESIVSFETLLKTSFTRIEDLVRSVENFMDRPETGAQPLAYLFEIAGHANNAAYRLQAASLDRLEIIITDRIQRYRQHFIVSLSAALISTVFAFSIMLYTVNYIRKSTSGIERVFKRLDSNDLTVRLEASSRDEMGELMKALGGFLDKLNGAFVSFNNNANLVSNATMELSTSSMEISATANQQSASVSEIVSTMENNKNLSAQAAEKTDEVAHLASMTQELSRKGANLRDANEEMMLDILNQNAKTIDIIRNLADMLSRIDESIQIIDTIADRTKLIAFNAALEASSSGEAGSRFSVVAGEIRRFADNVVESVSEIKEKIRELQEASQMLISEANDGSRAIDTGYKRMVEQKEVFENIVDVSRNVAIRSRQISSLSKQQETASNQVFTALKEISAGISQFVTSTAVTSATLEKLNVMSAGLKETLARYKTEEREDHDAK